MTEVTQRSKLFDSLSNMSHQAQVSYETKDRMCREEGEIERKPYFSFYGFHKGKLSDCQCQSDRVFYEHLAGPRPGLYSRAVIAVAIVGLYGERSGPVLLRGEPCLPALCNVLVE